MKGRTGRLICLGFQWNAGSWDDAAIWLNFLGKKLGGRKVHWNLPAFPPGSSSRKRGSLARSLRVRMEENGDAVTSMGFAGACHPLLNLDELEKEVSWGLKNPWETGIADVLGIRPSVLIPPMPDLARPEAWKRYRAHGFSLVGVNADAGFPVGAPREGTFPFARLNVAAAGPGDPGSRCARRLISARPDLFLLLDLSGLTDLGPLEFAIDELAAPLFANEGARLSLLFGDSSPAPTWPARSEGRTDWLPFSPSILRAKIKATAGISRKKRKKSDEYRVLLLELASADLPAPPTKGIWQDSQNPMRFAAQMLGEVTLHGPDFDVRLTGGRFCGITHGGEDLLPRRPAVSYARTAGRNRLYQTRCSFSFEDENGSGLREELGLEGEDAASLAVEYSFRNDCPLLSVMVEVRYPSFAGAPMVEEYAPWVMTLAELPRKGSATVEAQAPDGSGSEVHLSRTGAWVMLPGAMHRIRREGHRSILVQYAVAGARTWGIPFFRIARARGRTVLEMNPFGSYATVPAAALSGRHERLSLLIGLEDA